MTGYPEGAGDRRVSPEALRGVLADLFRRCGMAGGDADLLTDTLVAADLRGVHSHGALRVPEYVKKLTGAGVDPAGRPRVVTERAGAIVVDGANSMGQIGSAFAMERAIARAGDTGVAFAAVRGSNHCGAMAYYPMMALRHDMIGLAATNALPTMAPWDGLDKIVGINPLAVAIPAGEETPVVFDAAFSGSSHGKIRVYQQKGLPIPDHFAFDASGRPTTDPAEALEGLLQPIGRFKGVALAMVMGILSSLLSGAAYGTETGNMTEGPRPGVDGHCFMALDIAAFEEPGRFKERVDAIVREVHRSRPGEGATRLYVPGEPEAEAERRHRREGIPLAAETIRGLQEAAGRVGAEAAGLG